MRRLLTAILFWCAAVGAVEAQTVTLAWDPSISTNVVGYRVYRDGVASTGLLTSPATIPVVYNVAHTIYVTAIDAEGRESAQSNSVTAFKAAPGPAPLTLAAPPNQTVTSATSPVVVSFPTPTASGGVPPYSYSCTPASGSAFYEGSVQVNCSVFDSGGGIAFASFVVTVVVSAPPPSPTGCLTGGTLAPIGSTLTHTLKNGDVDAFINARKAEGWALLSRTKAKSQTTVKMECRG